MERLSANDFESNSEKSGQHIAGGTHQGIVINKQLDSSNYYLILKVMLLFTFNHFCYI
jgi:hypothetical protein